MDSRIREIEQRLAKAKTGLNDGGREDYLRQLYLLDAEIKAVIKDNGILPQAFAPKPKVVMTQSLAAPALRFAMSFGAVLFAATITYAAFQVASISTNPNQASAETAVATPPPTETIHASLPQSGDQGLGLASTPGELDTVQTTDGQPAEGLVAEIISIPTEDAEGTPEGTGGTQPVVTNLPQFPSSLGGVQTILASNIPPMENTPVYKASSPASPAAKGVAATGVDAGQIAPGQEAFDWTVARFSLPGQAKEVETEEIEVVNQLKEKLNESAGSSE